MINLFEIPEEGKTFKYSTETKELSDSLSDIIGTNKYESEFNIRPLNSKDFEIKGWIKTRTKEICSHCGLGIQFPVHAKFHDILIPPQDKPRDGKYSKPNHYTDDEVTGPDYAEYLEEMKFNIGDYLHEAIALVVPYNPAPELNPKGECTDCGQNVQSLLDTLLVKNEENHQEVSPFAALKGIKLQK